MTKVFISYGRGDDEAFVARLHERLTEAQFNVWFDRLAMPSRALSFLQEIRDAIHSSDRLVVVLGPHAATSDYVRAEWQYALTDEKIVVPLLRLGSFDLIPTELKDFHCEDCRVARDENAAFLRIIEVLREPAAIPGQIFGDVPSTPPCFQPRPPDMTNLAGVVLEELRKAIVLAPPERITLLYGMGGIGKSVMAGAFARSTGTRLAFPDGICWVGLRQDTTGLETLRQISVLLPHGAVQTFHHEASGANWLRGLLAGKRLLVVLDNVWSMEPLTAILPSLDPNTRVLVTSRDRGIGLGTGARILELGTVSEETALQLLADWSGVPVQNLPDTARDSARECGLLPFALALNGAMVRDGGRWEDLLRAIRSGRLDYSEQEFAGYPEYRNVARCIEVSIEALSRQSEATAQRLRDLAVFLSEPAIPEPAIQAFWKYRGVRDDLEVRKLLLTLDRKTLVHLEGESPRRSVFLHDLVRDHLRGTVPDKGALNRALLDCYRAALEGDWPTGPRDGYFHQHLIRHLLASEDVGEVERLLAGETIEGRPAWYSAKLAVADLTGYLSDVAAALEHERQTDIDKSAFSGSVGFQVAYALVLASFNSMFSATVSGRLWEAVVIREPANAAQWLPLLMRIPEEGVRGRALLRVAPFVRADQMAGVLRLAMELNDEVARSETLAGLTPHLSAPALELACDDIFQIGSDYARGRALEAIASLIPEVLWEKAFGSAEKIQDDLSRAHATIALATRLVQTGRITEAFERAGISGGVSWYWQAEAIKAFAPHLGSEDLRHAFRLTLASIAGKPRTMALSTLATYIPDDLIPTALTALENIDDDAIGNFAAALGARLIEPQLREAIQRFQPSGVKWRGAVLVRLIPLFAQIGNADEALTMVRGIEEPWPCALALSQISRHLPARLIPQALELARSIPDDPLRPGGQVFVLGNLACRVGEEEKRRLLDEVLDRLVASGSDMYKWADLQTMAPHLSLTQARHALGMLRGAESRDAAGPFVALVARIAELGEVGEAEHTAQEATEELTRANALQALAQYLPQSRIERIFKTNEVEQWPTSALVAMAPRIPEGLLPEVKRMLITPPIGDRRQRGQAQLRLFEQLAYRGSHRMAIEALPYLEDSLGASAVLAVIASDLPEWLLEAAIAFVKAVQNGGWYLALLLAQLPRYRRSEEAVTRIEAIDDDVACAEGLLHVLQSGNLDEPWARQAFVRLQEIDGAHSRWGDALERLAPSAPFNLLDDAIAAAKNLTKQRDRVLAHLVVRLAKAGRQPEIASIIDESWRQCTRALLKMVNPTVQDTPLRSAIRLARRIPDAKVRSHGVLELMHAVELNGYAETVLSAHETDPKDLPALQEWINFCFLIDDVFEALRTLDEPLVAAQIFARLAPRIDGTRMGKAWGVVQSLQVDKTAYLRALTAITRRAAVLGWKNWLERLTPLLIEARDEQYQDSVVHLGDTSRRLGLRSPSAQERVNWESVRQETATVILDLVREEVQVQRLGDCLDKLKERPNDREVWRHVVAGMLPVFESLSPADLHACVCSMLEFQARGFRPDMLDEMEFLAPALYLLGGPQTLLEAIKAIRDVGRWWS